MINVSYPIISCHKVRSGEDRLVSIKEGEAAGRHVVIVDDLVQSGNTLIQCAEVLRRHGASRVSAFVCHAIFPCEAWKKFVHSADKLGKGQLLHFWITNTHPVATQIADCPPFHLLSIGHIVKQVILDEMPTKSFL